MVPVQKIERRDIWTNRLKSVALGLAIAISALTIRHWYETFLFGHPSCENCRPDFPQFYAAAKLIWEASPMLYDEASQLAIQRTIDSRIGDALLPYTYPPFTAMVLMPLGWLSFPSAYALMTLISVLLLIVSVTLLVGHLQLTKEQTTWLILSALCNFGVHSVLLQGQVSFFLLLLLTVFTYSVDTRRAIGAGVSTGLVFLKPQLQLVPFVILITRRLWLALAIASIMIIGLVALSVLLVGWAGIQQYLSLLKTYLTIERGYGSNPEDMHNLRAVAQYIVPFAWSRYVWLALVLPVVATCFFLNAQSCADSKSAAAVWIGNFSASILITPHLYAHDLSILIVPIAFSLKLFGQPVPIWLILLLIAIGIFPLLQLVIEIDLPPLLPVILLIIYFWCFHFVRKTAMRSRSFSEIRTARI